MIYYQRTFVIIYNIYICFNIKIISANVCLYVIVVVVLNEAFIKFLFFNIFFYVFLIKYVV